MYRFSPANPAGIQSLLTSAPTTLRGSRGRIGDDVRVRPGLQRPVMVGWAKVAGPREKKSLARFKASSRDGALDTPTRN